MAESSLEIEFTPEHVHQLLVRVARLEQENETLRGLLNKVFVNEKFWDAVSVMDSAWSEIGSVLGWPDEEEELAQNPHG